MPAKVDRVVYVVLFAVWHHYTDNPVLTECPAAESSSNGTVLASGYSDNSIASFSVFLKPVFKPCRTFFYSIGSIKTIHTISSSLKFNKGNNVFYI